MADMLKGLFGGASSSAHPAPSDADFADFATAASPLAPSHEASTAFAGATSTPAASAMGSFFSGSASMAGRPYTKWYRVWERVTYQDFYTELVVLPFILVIVLLNAWGSYTNRSRAKQWAQAHLPLLEAEYASVGFGKGRTTDRDPASAQAMARSAEVPEDFMKQKAKNEYFTYATGRQNVASLDVQLTLYKRYNPFIWSMEMILSFFIDSFTAPTEKVDATAHVFDGKEKALLPQAEGGKSSSYDSFVFAVVHKDQMKKLRDARYDLSLTTTRDHAKLPDWATVMSESAEVTEAMLTPELIKAVNDVGEDLEALIVSDQPEDAPKKIDETLAKKRVSLHTRLTAAPASTAIFQYFLRLPDHLATHAHFRPEALRKVRATRDEELRKLRRVDEEEKAEERRLTGDKAKKEERERKLARMSAEEQKKFLDKERAQEKKKQTKKSSMRGG